MVNKNILDMIRSYYIMRYDDNLKNTTFVFVDEMGEDMLNLKKNSYWVEVFRDNYNKNLLPNEIKNILYGKDKLKRVNYISDMCKYIEGIKEIKNNNGDIITIEIKV